MFDADQGCGATRWPLVRISVGGKTTVTTLASKFFALSVHWQGQSFPCAGVDCPFCDFLPVRGVFYLPALCVGRVSILELASQSSSHLEQHCSLLHGGLRPGLILEISRRSAKSPIYSECVGKQEDCKAVDAVLFASRVLAIYHIPPANPTDTLKSYEERCRKFCQIRNGHFFERLKHAKKLGI